MSGSLSQALGLAEAMSLIPSVKITKPKTPWSYLPISLLPKSLHILPPEQQLAPPWPQFVIASGKRTIIPAMTIKKHNPQTRLIYLQNPRQFHNHFDHIIMPNHDRPAPNAITTLGAIHRASVHNIAQAQQTLPNELTNLPRPIVAVLIGGQARSFDLDLAATTHLIHSLNALSQQHQASLIILPSRRTPQQTKAMIKQNLSAQHAFIWQEPMPSPYLGVLGLADAFVVTEESVSMISEAASTSKPIYLFPLTHKRKTKRIQKFHQQLIKQNIARWFDGSLNTWHYPPLQETQRVAQLLLKQNAKVE